MSGQILETFSSATTRQVSKGSFLFHVGDPVRNVYFVIHGCLALQRISEAGSVMTLQSARAGNVLAEASIYSEAYHCDGIALSDTKCHVLPKTEFVSRLKFSPELQETWAYHLAKNIQSARVKAEIRGLKTVADRLDMWLLLNGPLPPKGQWVQIAAELGISAEALYREIKRRK